MGIEIYQVDAFTEKPFRGNPAAVCILLEPGKEAWMQNVAREMNLSETAFLHREGDERRCQVFILGVFYAAITVCNLGITGT